MKHGGHDIAKAIVQRRFKRTFLNFLKLYSPLADEWYVIDNSEKPVVIAHKKSGKEKIYAEKTFEKYFQ